MDEPEYCPIGWAAKPMACERTEDGYAVFNFTMTVPNAGYQICEGGLFGTVEGGGYVVVNSGSTAGATLSFNIDIYMPCNFDPIQTYEVRLYLCDEAGELTCFSFPFNFTCELPCGGGDSGSGGNSAPETEETHSGRRILYLPQSCQLYLDGRMAGRRKAAHRRVVQCAWRKDISMHRCLTAD